MMMSNNSTSHGHTLSETLRTYTFLAMVFIVGEIKVWKIKSRNAILDVPPQDSCCR